jgi:hypothetical protein
MAARMVRRPPAERGQDEAEFAAFFEKCLAGQGDR